MQRKLVEQIKGLYILLNQKLLNDNTTHYLIGIVAIQINFGSFFGEETKNDVRIKIKNDEQLQEAEKSFLELGQQRNLLVHKNFAETDVNTTVEEIYNKYCKACIFISLIETVLDPNYLKK